MTVPLPSTAPPTKPSRQPSRSPLWGWGMWGVVLATCLAVFMLYLRPGFLFTLADQLWACF